MGQLKLELCWCMHAMCVSKYLRSEGLTIFAIHKHSDQEFAIHHRVLHKE